MALHQLTKSDSYFLVKYVIDDKFQVRSRRLIRVAEEMEITIGQHCSVQWGNKRQIDEAKIIASGSKSEMKMELNSTISKDKPRRSKSGKPLARVICVVSPPSYISQTHEPIPLLSETQAHSPTEPGSAITRVNPTTPVEAESQNCDEAAPQNSETCVPDHQQFITQCPTDLSFCPEVQRETQPLQDTPARNMIYRQSLNARLSSIAATQRAILEEMIQQRKRTEIMVRENQEINEQMQAMRGLVDQLAAASNSDRRPLLQLSRLIVSNEGSSAIFRNRTFHKKFPCNWTSGYKWSTAFVLSITLGGFGVDRFYLGLWREGIGKLFSFGGLGVWTILDVILIAVGYVGPYDGSLYIYPWD